MSNHWLNLTEFSREFWWTFTSVLVDTIPTCSPVLTHVVGAIIYISGAILSHKSQETLTGVMREMILTFATIFAWVLFIFTNTAESNLFLAVSSLKSWHTIALVFTNFVDAGSIVLTPVI